MQSNIPLAERLRPRTLDEYIGQEHLVGPQGVFRKFIETGNVPSFILWGPPGVGKTTLAKLVATALERKLFTLSAVTSGVKEVREVIEQARKSQFFNTPSPFLFIDEIHRFNKSQQDSLLGAVEQGVVTLIGATTENPSFEVISPLLSRCQVYVLKAMEEADLQLLLERAVTTDPTLRERVMQYNMPVTIGRNCWLGAGVIVMPGVSIGDNSVIGAGSVVTRDIPADSLAAGNPCRVMRPITEADRMASHPERMAEE